MTSQKIQQHKYAVFFYAYTKTLTVSSFCFFPTGHSLFSSFYLDVKKGGARRHMSCTYNGINRFISRQGKSRYFSSKLNWEKKEINETFSIHWKISIKYGKFAWLKSQFIIWLRQVGLNCDISTILPLIFGITNMWSIIWRIRWKYTAF